MSSKVTERALFECERLAAGIEEGWRRAALVDDADLGEWHARLRDGGLERGNLLRRHGTDDLVVVAAGGETLAEGGAARQSGTHDASTRALTRDATQSLAKSPTSPSETSIAAEACRRSASASTLR